MLLVAMIVALGLALASCSSEGSGEVSPQLDEVAREYADYYARYYAEYYAEHYAKQFLQPTPAGTVVRQGSTGKTRELEPRGSIGPWPIFAVALGSTFLLQSYESISVDEEATLYVVCMDYRNPPQMGIMVTWDGPIANRKPVPIRIPVDVGWNGQKAVREPNGWMVSGSADSVIPPFERAAQLEKSISKNTHLEIVARGSNVHSAKFDLTDYSEAAISIRAKCK